MRWPVDSVSVTSGYGQLRANGVRHWGLDLGGHAGDAVRAPEDGFIVAAVWGRGTAVGLPHPLDGYGPGAVLIRGMSGVYHLLAHLDPAHRIDLFAGEPVHEGEQLSVMPAAVGKAGPHTHWEVRTPEPYDQPLTREANTMDPRAWLRGESPADAKAEWKTTKTAQGYSNIVPPSLTTQVTDAVATSRSAPSQTNGASSGAVWFLLALLLLSER